MISNIIKFQIYFPNSLVQARGSSLLLIYIVGEVDWRNATLRRFFFASTLRRNDHFWKKWYWACVANDPDAWRMRSSSKNSTLEVIKHRKTAVVAPKFILVSHFWALWRAHFLANVSSNYSSFDFGIALRMSRNVVNSGGRGLLRYFRDRVTSLAFCGMSRLFCEIGLPLTLCALYFLRWLFATPLVSFVWIWILQAHFYKEVARGLFAGPLDYFWRFLNKIL